MIRTLFLSTILSLTATHAFAECASKTPFEVEWAGFTTTTVAQFNAGALAQIDSRFGQIPADTTLGLDSRIEFVRIAKGAYASEAFGSVLDHYSCVLSEAYPERSEDIEEAIAVLQEEILPPLFDPALYYSDDSEIYLGLFEKRQDVAKNTRDMIKEEDEEILPRKSVLLAIENENFVEQTSFEAFVRAYIGDIAEVDACAGTGLQSIEVVDLRVIRAVAKIREALAHYFKGGSKTSRTRFVSLTMNLMTELNSPTSQEKIYKNVPLSEVLCLAETAQQQAQSFEESEEEETLADDSEAPEQDSVVSESTESTNSSNSGSVSDES